MIVDKKKYQKYQKHCVFKENVKSVILSDNITKMKNLELKSEFIPIGKDKYSKEEIMKQKKLEE